MSIELIYKTTSPEAISWWRLVTSKESEQRERRREFEALMLETYGPSLRPDYSKPEGEREPRRSLWVSGDHVIGVDAGYDERPPADSGWRLDAKDRIWKPALKTAAGKRWKQRLGELTVYSPREHLPEIGIPQIAFADSSMYRCGLDFDEHPEPTLYQMWGSGRCATECAAAQEKTPSIEWVEVPRSAWYAREEAKGATS